MLFTTGLSDPNQRNDVSDTTNHAYRVTFLLPQIDEWICVMAIVKADIEPRLMLSDRGAEIHRGIDVAGVKEGAERGG